jgi:hypothetical protein
MKAVKFGVVLFLLAFLSAPSLFADAAYSYKGNYFDGFVSTIPNNPYTTSDRVTMWFTATAPLPPNGNWSSFTPNSYSFSDGLQTIDSNTVGAVLTHFYLVTDSSGALIQWELAVWVPTNYSGIATVDVSGLAINDYGIFYPSGAPPDYWEGGNSNAPGTWGAVPEPGTLAMVTTGGIGVAGLIRRKLLR